MFAALLHRLRHGEGVCCANFFACVLVFALASIAEAQHGDRHNQYVAAIQELDKEAPSFMRKEGRDAVIQRLQAIIAQFPEFDENVRIEMRIANLYENAWPNAPQDIEAAYRAYKSIIERYDANLPEVKRAKWLAAERGREKHPDECVALLRALPAEYPDDDSLRLQSYWLLGITFQQQGRKAEAEDCLASVLSYDPPPDLSDKERQDVQHVQSNSAVAMFWLALEPDAPPVVQLASLNAMINRYPGWIGIRHSALVESVKAPIQERIAEEQAEDERQALTSAPVRFDDAERDAGRSTPEQSAMPEVPPEEGPQTVHSVTHQRSFWDFFTVPTVILLVLVAGWLFFRHRRK